MAERRKPGKAGRGGRNRKPATQSTVAKNANDNRKKTLADYVFYIGSAKQASDYVVTSQYILNHIRKTFEHGDDIADALEAQQKPDFDDWMPALRISSAENEAQRAAEGAQYAILYKAKIESFVRRTDTLR